MLDAYPKISAISGCHTVLSRLSRLSAVVCWAEKKLILDRSLSPPPPRDRTTERPWASLRCHSLHDVLMCYDCVPSRTFPDVQSTPPQTQDSPRLWTVHQPQLPWCGTELIFSDVDDGPWSGICLDQIFVRWFYFRLYCVVFLRMSCLRARWCCLRTLSVSSVLFNANDAATTSFYPEIGADAR